MNIYLIRHGQTRLNKAKQMQGRLDEPLSVNGKRQAEQMHEQLADIPFDAVYASPLRRAHLTASIVSGWKQDDIILDERLLEVSFGKYEGKNYYTMGLGMTLYWAVPEIFPVPDTVETLDEMRARSRSFLQDLEKQDYENVLIAAHGGILRAMNGYLLDRKNGLLWRPKMGNCEVRVYSSVDGSHRFLRDYKLKE